MCVLRSREIGACVCVLRLVCVVVCFVLTVALFSFSVVVVWCLFGVCVLFVFSSFVVFGVVCLRGVACCGGHSAWCAFRVVCGIFGFGYADDREYRACVLRSREIGACVCVLRLVLCVRVCLV